MSFAVVLHLMLVYAMLCSDAIMSSVITKYVGTISLVCSLCIQKSSYMSLILIFLFIYHSFFTISSTYLFTNCQNNIVRTYHINTMISTGLFILTTGVFLKHRSCFVSPVSILILSGLFKQNGLILLLI